MSELLARALTFAYIWGTMTEKKNNFYCPLSPEALWEHNLEYIECPLNPPYRDTPECKSCKLKVDQKWVSNKEAWKDLPVKKKKPKKRKHNGSRHSGKGKKRN